MIQRLRDFDEGEALDHHYSNNPVQPARLLRTIPTRRESVQSRASQLHAPSLAQQALSNDRPMQPNLPFVPVTQNAIPDQQQQQHPGQSEQLYDPPVQLPHSNNPPPMYPGYSFVPAPQSKYGVIPSPMGGTPRPMAPGIPRYASNQTGMPPVYKPTPSLTSQTPVALETRQRPRKPEIVRSEGGIFINSGVQHYETASQKRKREKLAEISRKKQELSHLEAKYELLAEQVRIMAERISGLRREIVNLEGGADTEDDEYDE